MNLCVSVEVKRERCLECGMKRRLNLFVYQLKSRKMFRVWSEEKTEYVSWSVELQEKDVLNIFKISSEVKKRWNLCLSVEVKRERS